MDKKITKTTAEVVVMPALKMLKIRFPQTYIDEINDHIDKVIIPANKSFADGLVGQLKQNKRSAQLTIPFDDDFGKKFKSDLEEIANLLIQSENGFNRNAKADAFSCWSNHAYSGDYNPFHSHGVGTPAGLSSFLYLKVPKCISTERDNTSLNNASGAADGWTQLIWGTNTRKELFELREQEQEYVKPVVGLMLIFPHWLNHLVMPFFGKGERRSLAANFNIRDTKDEVTKYMSAREKRLFEEKYND
tara:strand:+ start:464 stop:1204 length:741 start_codon:yes stop_codon:yes gene_type:complete